MLKLVRGDLVWSEADDLAMARVLGSDHAVKHKSPWLASIAEAARQERVMLSPKVLRALGREEAFRELIRPWRKAEDAPGDERWFAHQRADVRYMARAGLPAYLLGHQPGVGKTLEAMMFMHRIAKASRVLVVCPGSAKDQWRREVRRWLHLKHVRVTHGTVADQIRQLARPDGWTITHWESLVHARLGVLQLPWDGVILDEAHQIQNRNAQRTDTVHALEANWRLALTAHPFANDLSELWPILAFLYPEQYTSFWRWAGLHIDMVPKAFGGMDMTGATRPRLLKWELRPFLLRRTKRQVFKNLPRVTRQRLEAELTERGRREYAQLRKQFFAQLADELGEDFLLPIINTFARTTRLRQYLVDPALVGGGEKSVKYPIVLELLKDTVQPFVIFTSFAQAAIRLKAFLDKDRKLQTGVLRGGMKAGTQRQLEKRFQRGDLHALVCVTAYAKESLNLGGFGYVAHLDLPWHAKDYEQTEGRVDRPQEGTGKLVPTTSYRIIVPDTYEEKIEKKIERKHRQFGEVFTIGSLKELFA